MFVVNTDLIILRIKFDRLSTEIYWYDKIHKWRGEDQYFLHVYQLRKKNNEKDCHKNIFPLAIKVLNYQPPDIVLSGASKRLARVYAHLNCSIETHCYFKSFNFLIFYYFIYHALHQLAKIIMIVAIYIYRHNKNKNLMLASINGHLLTIEIKRQLSDAFNKFTSRHSSLGQKNY